MRKYEQQQILTLLKTIEEAQTAELFADCQECAISIGEYIEQIKGEGTMTVTLLEEYCELLYRASIGEAGHSSLGKQLLRIENSVKNELKPTRIEVVFLSYKASMSDCLESIYLAAKEDPTCDAYWIPIPYYDRKPDGSFESLHYEGAEYYKENIICTDWHEYNIEERRPDVIFTFSPYDSLGHMTSVHPDYYCERLRGLTEQLVYIPYYVTLDEIREPYTKCPGVVYSHLVIVQSENVRKDFIRDYKELEKLGYSREKYGAPESKFIALGSPKVDAVINAKPEDYLLPEDWRKLIEPLDGTKKKSILFNTSITASLNNSEQYLKKLQFVLDAFRDNHEVVLWWRPHPLGRMAFVSMNPDLANEYDQLVSNYKCEGWGIYDETVDLHRAIALTDAYYGDMSSLIPLYLLTGKPLMINEPAIMEYTQPFEPTCFYVTENKVWFSVRRLNALLCMDKIDWSLELIGSFPDEEDYIEEHNDSLYRVPVESDGKLYFPPFLANEIALFSITDSTFEKIKYKKLDNAESASMDFLGAVAYGDIIYFTPYKYTSILRLNTKTKKISYHSDWFEPLKKIVGDTQYAYLGLPFVLNGLIWFTALCANIVIHFDMETCEHTLYEVGNKDYRFSSITSDGKDFWISPHGCAKTPCIKWNPKEGVIREFPQIYDDNDDAVFYPCIYLKGDIWLLPVSGRYAIKINAETNDISIANEFESGPVKDKAGAVYKKYVYAQAFSDSIYSFFKKSGTFREYNCTSQVRREELLHFSPAVASKLSRLSLHVFPKETPVINSMSECKTYESNNIRISDFITYATDEFYNEKATMQHRRSEVIRSLIAKSDGTSGKSIYDFTKSKILG